MSRFNVRPLVLGNEFRLLTPEVRDVDVPLDRWLEIREDRDSYEAHPYRPIPFSRTVRKEPP